MKDANGTRNNLGGSQSGGSQNGSGPIAGSQNVDTQGLNAPAIQGATGHSLSTQGSSAQGVNNSGVNGSGVNGSGVNGSTNGLNSYGTNRPSSAVSRVRRDRPEVVKPEPTRRPRRSRRRLSAAPPSGTDAAMPLDRRAEAARASARGDRPLLVSRADSRTSNSLGQPASPVSISAKRSLAGKPSAGKPSAGKSFLGKPSLGKLALNNVATGKFPVGKSASKRSALPTRTPRRRNTRRSFKTPLPLLYLSWLVISGLGLAVIGGTLLTVLPNSSARSAARTESALATSAQTTPTFPIELNQEIAALKSQLQNLPNLYPDLSPKAFYIDVDTGNYVDLEGSAAIAAASTIKLPILLAFFEEVDAGRINLNQTMAIQPEQIAEGSGEMQLSPPGTQFTALEVATQMIVGSDNTATNMMIDLLGGAAALNPRFKEYGLEKTQILNPLPDLEGTNLTSARDLARTMLMISQGDTLTMRSRDRVLNILQRTRNKSLLANGLAEKDALTYNKTGDIASALSDVVLVDLPNGKRYVVAALVTRPSNDGRAAELINRISQYAYQESEKAIQPAVSPLGNPDGNPAQPSAAPSGSSDSTSPEGASATPPSEAQPPAEEPYPSANPRSSANPEAGANPDTNP